MLALFMLFVAVLYVDDNMQCALTVPAGSQVLLSAALCLAWDQQELFMCSSSDPCNL